MPYTQTIDAQNRPVKMIYTFENNEIMMDVYFGRNWYSLDKKSLFTHLDLGTNDLGEQEILVTLNIGASFDARTIVINGKKFLDGFAEMVEYQPLTFPDAPKVLPTMNKVKVSTQYNNVTNDALKDNLEQNNSSDLLDTLLEHMTEEFASIDLVDQSGVEAVNQAVKLCQNRIDHFSSSAAPIPEPIDNYDTDQLAGNINDLTI